MSDYFDPSPRASKRRRVKTQQNGPNDATRYADASTYEYLSGKVNEHAGSPYRSEEQIHVDPASPACESREDDLTEVAHQQPDTPGFNAPVINKSSQRAGKRRTSLAATLRDKRAKQYDEESSVDNSVQARIAGTKSNGMTQEESAGPVDTSDNEGGIRQNDFVSRLPRSSGRERRRPRRFSSSPERSGGNTKIVNGPSIATNEFQSPSKAQSVNTRGILTPSKRQRGGLKKTVAFDHDERGIEGKFGFKDIETFPTKSNKSTSRSSIDSLAKRTQLKKVSESMIRGVAQSESLPSNVETVAGEQTEDDDDDTSSVLFEQIIKESPQVDVSTFIHDDTQLCSPKTDTALIAVKSQIITRLVSNAAPSPSQTPILAHLESQFVSLCNLLTATVATGESNSLLLLGSRGSGKSHLLNVALEALTAKFVDDFHTVRLNGFIQTDDRLALREIWRQLGRELNIDDTETESLSSYADTMSSLLSLLSHPDELSDAGRDSLLGMDDTMVTPARTSKSIIFILDEFDLFTTHARQTLLYNLFDIAQSRKAPIAVVGCSTRMDVVECLEKRVKSRFSHRWLHIPTAKSLDGFREIIRTTLMIEEREDFRTQGGARRARDVDMRTRWNHYIQNTFLPSEAVEDLIRHSFYTNKSISDALAALYIPVATIRIDIDPKEDIPTTSASYNIQPSLLNLLPCLPTLHLSLLIASARLDTVYNLPAFNFNVVYDHLVELINRSKMQHTTSSALSVGTGFRRWTSNTARRAWEDLGVWGAIVPVSGKSASLSSASMLETVGGEGASTRMWRVDPSLEDLSWALRRRESTQHSSTGAGGVAAGAIDLLGRWCREV